MITGIQEELDKIETAARFASEEYYKAGVRVTLMAAVFATRHSSSNAAFNWHVVPEGASAQYTDFHGSSPVGQSFEGRSVSGNTAAIQVVAAASLDRENANIIENIKLVSVTFSNPVDDLGNDLYTAQAGLREVEDILVRSISALHEEALSEVLKTKAGDYIGS